MAKTVENSTTILADDVEMKAPTPDIIADEPDRANPFNEPIDAVYSDGGPADPLATETVVEHPLSPTDTNPNPHGNRDEPFVATVTKEGGRTAPEEGPVEITGLSDEPVHLGDGRTLAKGEKAKVTAEVAKTLTHNKQAKRA